MIDIPEHLPQLTEWKPRFRKGKHFTTVLSAPRNSGKSYAIKRLYNRHWRQLFDITIVFSNSLDNGFYQGFVPGKLLIQGFDSEVLFRTFEEQSKSMAEKGTAPNILIIFDDCVSVKQKHSDEILQVFSRGRHKNISCVFSTQHLPLIDASWRSNIDFLIVLKQRSHKKFLIDTMLSDVLDADDYGLPERIMWRQLLKAVTVDYHALIIDFINQDGTAQNTVFIWKA